MTTVQATQPTGTRHKVIAFAITLAVLSYIDRVCISQAAPIISKEFNLTKDDMGTVFAAFALAYALFEIPGGWMGDKIGPRKVLMRIVIWWSFFTAITGFMWDKTSLVVARFLFGAGEAGCFPNLTKSFTTWLPVEERVRAQGILWMSARWGGAFTPLLVVFHGEPGGERFCQIREAAGFACSEQKSGYHQRGLIPHEACNSGEEGPPDDDAH